MLADAQVAQHVPVSVHQPAAYFSIFRILNIGIISDLVAEDPNIQKPENREIRRRLVHNYRHMLSNLGVS